MAELVGLKMQGIRSIGDEPHLITFLNPLTIIQGPNGTGKTTTIEALNYITTGALPAGKMQSFIHNMKLANRARVDALVQLQFKDIKGNLCTATKRMNASSVKTGKSKTQSDEFTLVVKDKFGNNKSLSSKVADFNKEMLNLLGVPKAILEHVIFCHQEESNWPLSEPKELKVRFDAIFEVTKYVKALDNIKRSLKDLEFQIRLIDESLPHLNANRQSRANLVMSQNQNKQMLENNKKIIEKHRADKEVIDAKIKELSKDVELAGSVKHREDLLRSQIQTKTQFLSSMSAEDDYVGSREDLIEELNRLRDSRTEQQADRDQKILVKEIEQQLRKAEEDSQLLGRSVSRNEQALNQTSNTVTIKQAQLDKYNKIIAEVSSQRDAIESRLEEIRLVLAKSRSDLGQINGCRFLYGNWEIEIAEKQACPLCERPCLNRTESKKLALKVKQKQENIPAEAKLLEGRIKKLEEEERRLLKVIPFIGMAEAIEKELPKYHEQLKRAGDIVLKEKNSKESKDSELANIREKLRRAQNIPTDSRSQDHEIRIMQDQLRKMDLQNELNELQRQLKDVQWNGRDYRSLLKENEQLGSKATELNNKIHQKVGEQTQIEHKLKEAIRELNTPRYAEAKEIYICKLVDRVVVQSTIQDLNKYWKVLDDAIIAFHQQKMEQINQILAELWTRVYQGNDIETIKIKSLPVSGGEKKKSYDYSVVMVVDQTEIDMRDHCSAGQKVLASILVRIALADVFCGNCPVLALDEPTTNLDADKVENVGIMLKSLIEVRNNMYLGDSQESDQTASQSLSQTDQLQQPLRKPVQSKRSLQLLVITHDKRLVDHLYLACRPEFIYGLSKDENGVSRIRQHQRICDTNIEYD